MRVKMLSTAAGPDGTFRAGETWALDPALANQFVTGGYAVAVDPDPVLVTTVAPPENAVTRQPGSKRKAVV